MRTIIGFLVASALTVGFMLYAKHVDDAGRHQAVACEVSC